MIYAEPVAASYFSFLRGASSPADLLQRALELGYSGLGLADRNSVAGVVRAYSALKAAQKEVLAETGREYPFKLMVGARLCFADDTPDIVVYPENREGWGRLCRLLTEGNLRGRKGECILRRDDLSADPRNLLFIVMPPRNAASCRNALEMLVEGAGGSVWLGATMPRRGNDRRRLLTLRRLSDQCGAPLIATNDVLYDVAEKRPLQDILTCIREGLKIESAGRILEANAERHLKTSEEMQRLFRDAPDAVVQTQHFLARMNFSLGELKPDYPDEPVPPGKTAQSHLEDLCWRRADLRYPDGVPPKVEKLLGEELVFIAEADYARYFLTIHDIVRFAEDRGILCQGRGSAANSVVCFILGITNVDPEEIDVLFARFLSKEREEPPDIDVDFEHERREEVIQYMYARYGRRRAAIAATVISYRPRSAIREVGKVLGLSEDITSALASTVWGGWGNDLPESHVRQAGHVPTNPEIARAVRFANQLIGFPRHLSQHVGGFILTRGRLDEIVPIGNAAMDERTFIEWDRNDIATLGLMKVDVLALGMLTCIRKALVLLHELTGVEHTLASIPREEPEVYDMLCKGDSIGVFQVESRAQINMLPRLKPRCFYDLAIQVAIVRPGPIQGDMVHPYLRRRALKDAVEFPAPAPEHGPPDELVEVLGKTLGVPLFQEQAMRLAMVAARFTPDESNELRRAMATFRNAGTMHNFGVKMIEGMVRRGYERDFAERCFKQIEGFGSYGFPESHAAAFAHLVYVSSWIKYRYPAVFAAALLNSQPMGFYAPAQIVRDAREHGVEVRPIDLNKSFWDNTLERDGEEDPALRIGFRQIDGFREEWSEHLVAHRASAYPDIETLARRTELPRRALELLADADACRSVGLDRRKALWAVRRIPGKEVLPLFAYADAAELADEADAGLPLMRLSEHVVTDYQTTRLSLKAHPISFLRERYDAEGLTSCREAGAKKDGTWCKVAGVVLVRQRPGEGKAIFITLEDETGITNVVLWASQLPRLRRVLMGARLLEAYGKIQKSEEGVVHLMAQTLTDRSKDLSLLSETTMDFAPASKTSPHPRNIRIVPKSRDFH